MLHQEERRGIQGPFPQMTARNTPVGGGDGSHPVEVVRYICPRCRRTWSVIPEGMMPYRSLSVRLC